MHTRLKGALPKNPLALAAIALLLTGLILRLAGLEFVSGDMRGFVLRWYGQLARQGFAALGTDFSNYTPPYLYLLWIATGIRAWLADLTAIKLVSMLFDAGSAAWVYKIVRIKYPQGAAPLLGGAIFFSLPTVWLNSAWWGQADGIYTFFVLACLYFLLRERPLPAMIFFGVAVSFKLQAAFFAPFLLLLALKGRIPWRYLLSVPLVYLALMLPAVLAGRPLIDTLTVYLAQAGTFHQLTMNAPSLYAFISNDWYEPAALLGLGLTALLALAWALFYARRVKTWTPEILVMCATVSALMMPFFLPKMHERYFYLADGMLLLLALYLPRLWYLVPISQLVSTITYSVYLFSPGRPSFNPAGPGTPPLLIAALLNTGLLALVFWQQYRLVKDNRVCYDSTP